MNIDEIKNLKMKALAASRGPWEMEWASIGDNGMAIITEYFVRPDGADYAIASGISDPETGLKSKANAGFIASTNPDVVLELIRELETFRGEHSRAVKTLQKAGYTDHGGELWKPPLGSSPDPLLKRIDALTAERDAASKQAATLRAALVAVFGTDDLIALEVLGANYRHH